MSKSHCDGSLDGGNQNGLVCDMKINVKRIPPEGESLRGEETAAIMEIEEPDLRFRQPIAYDLLAQIQGPSLLVTGRLATCASLRCSRCLREFEWPVAVPQFVFMQELHGEDFADLTEALREDIMLELPQRVLCREQCRGLCPQCGRDLNEGVCQCAPTTWETHWQALDQLKPK